MENLLSNTQIQGAITEQQCFLYCLQYGFQVSKPLFDNARYDFILDTGKQLLKIQIKTSRWKDDKKEAFIFNCYSQHNTGNGNKKMKYTNKEVDFFMTVMDNKFYLYPVPEVGITEKTLRILPPKNGCPSVFWAKDYVFEEMIKQYC